MVAALSNVKQYLVFEDERPCPLCGHSNYRVLSSRMQHELNCKTVICNVCAFCFVSPLPQEKKYNEFYANAYAHFYHKIHKNTGYEIRENPYDTMRFDAIEEYKSLNGSSFLEIGPGRGRVLELAARRGATCYAVEPSNEFRGHLHSRGFPIIGRFVEDISVDQKFDFICFFQVLEHLRYPAETLARLKKLLNPGGLLVLDVPNIWKPYRSLDRYFLRYVHLSYFSPNSLSRLLSNQGIHVLHMDTGYETNLQPQPIFVIARASEHNDKNEVFEVDDPEKLHSFLRKYRIKYPILIAPKFFPRLWLKRFRNGFSRSFLGSIVRRIRHHL